MSGSGHALSEAEAKRLNDLEAFLSFTPTWQYIQFLHLNHKLIGLFTGNQAGKTSSLAHNFVLRILGIHPVPEKNVLYFECKFCGRKFRDSILRGTVVAKPFSQVDNWRPKDNECPTCGGQITIHKRKSKTFRFCSETLPGEKGGGDGTLEVKNTIYPAFRQWLPPFLIRKDITFRNPAMSLYDINHLHQFGPNKYHGTEIIVEFVSYSQTVQAGAGVQRVGIWADELPPFDFYEEQLPRLVAEDGDFVISLTPASALSWTFDEIYERAELYVRTQAMCDFMAKDTGEHVDRVTKTDTNSGIAVVQFATDDNPTLTPEAITNLYEKYDDPDVIATRRYGVHKQTKGRIFKDFDFGVHVIDPRRFFLEEEGKPFNSWLHARLIDFHTHNPWAVMWVALSPDNELFVYDEWAPSPQVYNTREIATEIAKRSGDTKFLLNLIDPLSVAKQPNTSKSPIDDLNAAFREMHKEGLGTGGRWEGWDTKSERGRDAIRMRLKNSKLCDKPFNNKKDVQFLPTLWVHNNCTETARSLRQWRMEEWAPGRQNYTKEPKETPQQKHSHFCMCLEAILKHSRWRPRVTSWDLQQRKTPRYFQGRT